MGANAPAGAPRNLDFLRSSPQFQALRTMVQANPQILQVYMSNCFGACNISTRVYMAVQSEVAEIPWMPINYAFKNNFSCRHVEEESSNSHPDIIFHPFFRNINEPTNFSFTLSVPIPLPGLQNKRSYS